MKQISLIAAISPERVIGNENQLPWQLPADLQYFRKMTLVKPVVMGRKTFESIGRALPGRRNIVVSRNKAFQAPNCEVFTTIDQALAIDSEEIMVIGGGRIYAAVLPKATRMYLTFVHQEFAGDTFFPAWDKDEWQEVSREDHTADEDNSVAYSFVVLSRAGTEKS